MLDSSSLEDSKTCAICIVSFSFFGSSKYICSFCFKAVCKRCSMQKAIHPESSTMRRICDTCYSEMIKGLVMTHYKFEQDRLRSEIYNFQKRMEIEKLNCEKDLKIIEDLSCSIEDTKNEIKHREIEKISEISMLKQEIDKIDSDYQDISSRLDLLSLKYVELDAKISNFQELNKLFLTGDQSSIQLNLTQLEAEIKELNDKLKDNKRFAEREKTDAKLKSIQEDIKILNSQKSKYTEKIKELKSIESIKEQSISILLSSLSNNSVPTELKPSKEDLENEETHRVQEEEIFKLKKKLEKIQRKNVIESQKCDCSIN